MHDTRAPPTRSFVKAIPMRVPPKVVNTFDRARNVRQISVAGEPHPPTRHSHRMRAQPRPGCRAGRGLGPARNLMVPIPAWGSPARRGGGPRARPALRAGAGEGAERL